MRYIGTFRPYVWKWKTSVVCVVSQGRRRRCRSIRVCVRPNGRSVRHLCLHHRPRPGNRSFRTGFNSYLSAKVDHAATAPVTRLQPCVLLFFLSLSLWFQCTASWKLMNWTSRGLCRCLQVALYQTQASPKSMPRWTNLRFLHCSVSDLYSTRWLCDALLGYSWSFVRECCMGLGLTFAPGAANLWGHRTHSAGTYGTAFCFQGNRDKEK